MQSGERDETCMFAFLGVNKQFDSPFLHGLAHDDLISLVVLEREGVLGVGAFVRDSGNARIEIAGHGPSTPRGEAARFLEGS